MPRLPEFHIHAETLPPWARSPRPDPVPWILRPCPRLDLVPTGSSSRPSQDPAPWAPSPAFRAPSPGPYQDPTLQAPSPRPRRVPAPQEAGPHTDLLLVAGGRSLGKQWRGFDKDGRSRDAHSVSLEGGRLMGRPRSTWGGESGDHSIF